MRQSNWSINSMSATRPDPSLRQRGIGVIAALMVTLVVGGMAVMLARITATQAISYALDERGVRAYWAARAGLEWGSYQIRLSTPSCAASTAVTMPANAESLSEFKVIVTCVGSGPYLLTATACAEGDTPPVACGSPTSSTYVERVLTRAMN